VTERETETEKETETHTHTRTHMHARTHAHTHTRTYTHTKMQIHTHTHEHTHIHTHAHMHTPANTHTHTHTHKLASLRGMRVRTLFTHMYYVRKYAPAYIYIYKCIPLLTNICECYIPPSALDMISRLLQIIGLFCKTL